MEIAPFLAVTPGVTALIGGGGKTTLLERLGEELRRRGTVILCTTTRIFRPKYAPVAKTTEEAWAQLGKTGFTYVGTDAENGKLSAGGIPMSVLLELADYVIAEADGAKGLPLKAHAPWEPVIPPESGNTILVVGARGLGQPIRKVCHRPERYAELAGIPLDGIASAEAEARVILAEGYGDRVYVNQVETPQSAQAAESLGRAVNLPVVAGSLFQEEYQCLF